MLKFFLELWADSFSFSLRKLSDPTHDDNKDIQLPVRNRLRETNDNNKENSIDEVQVDHLVAKGYDRLRVVDALRVARNNMTMAEEILETFVRHWGFNYAWVILYQAYKCSVLWILLPADSMLIYGLALVLHSCDRRVQTSSVKYICNYLPLPCLPWRLL